MGQSAGAIVAGSTIRPAYWKGWDDPSAGGSLEEVEWTDEKLKCMGLVPNRAFFPHYDEQWAATVEERRAELRGAELLCLTDDGRQAFVSGDDEVEEVEEP